MTKLLLFASIALCLISCSIQEGQAEASQPVEDSLSFDIDQILKKGYFNGFGVAIVNEKGMLYQNGFGVSDVVSKKRYTENTIQNIASVSKTLVGIALMKAQELGKLRLDDPINKYLPFKVYNPNFPAENITIRQLANHTSSIIDNEFYFSKNYYLKPEQDLKGLPLVFDGSQVLNPASEFIPLHTFLRNVLATDGKWYQKEGFLHKKPGEIYEYSNTATALAAYIVELATGMPFDEFTKENILKPLNMNASGWKFSDVNFSQYSRLYENPQAALPFYQTASYPDGNFITSVSDLSKYLSELIKGYNGHGTILSNESYKELFRQQLSVSNFIERNDKNPYSESYNVGIFMGFGHTGYIGHTGGDPGVISIMFFDPKTNIGRLMILNTSFSDKGGNDAFYAIWNVLEKYQHKLSN